MDFFHVMNQIGILFAVMVLGFILSKMNIIDDHTSRKLSTFIVKVSAPFLIIVSMAEPSILTTTEIFQVLLISFSIYGFLFLTTLFIPKITRVPEADVGIYQFILMFSNVAFMGFPVAYAIFQEAGIVYAAILNLPFNLLAFTIGIRFVTPKDLKKDFVIKDVINAGVISVFIGLFFFWTGIQFTGFFHSTMKMVGDLTTPLSMIVIGSTLSKVDFKVLLKNGRIYFYTFLKLIVFPLMVMVILKSLGFEGIMVGIPTIITGMPVAANAVILSKEYGGNDVLATEAVFLSTLFCILTIPFLALLL